ncbi:MAG: hypothetical protein IPJ88_11375 [Myxococcales bacterium]|nr:MAG: hypothetical protein IPJ88_11375 [Myxococcales bacterium]
MISRLVTTLLILASLASFGCEVEGVGDPCVPEAIQSGGFDEKEFYIEPSSVQCRTRFCLVYQLQGDPTNVCADGVLSGTDGCLTTDEVADRVYCTCKCGGENSNCDCPDGFRCEEIFGEETSPGIAGSYCVKSSIPRK